MFASSFPLFNHDIVKPVKGSLQQVLQKSIDQVEDIEVSKIHVTNVIQMALYGAKLSVFRFLDFVLSYAKNISNIQLHKTAMISGFLVFRCETQ